MAELAAQLFVGLAISSTTGVKGVANCAGPLRAILMVPVVWLKAFLAFNCLIYALI